MKPGYLILGPGTVPGSVGHMQHAAAWVCVFATRRAPAPSLLPSASPLITAAFFGHIPGNTALLACEEDAATRVQTNSASSPFSGFFL